MLHEPTVKHLKAMKLDAMAVARAEPAARPADAEPARPAVDHENVRGARRYR